MDNSQMFQMQSQSLIRMDPGIYAGHAIISTLFGTFNDTNGAQNSPLRQSYRHLYSHYEIVRNLAKSSGFRSYIQSQATPPIISDIMQQIQAKTRSEITSDLLQGVPNGTEHADEAVNTFLTFIIRVWLMCRTGDFPGEPRQGQNSVPWLEESTLSGALENHFHQNIMNGGEEKLRLEKAFKACNFERYGGIRIIWTSNLLDHLRLYDPSDEDEPYQLLLFHHVGLLEYHQKGEIFPEGLVEETLRTLALLLPKYDLATEKWFKAQLQLMNHSIDPRASHCKPLDPSQRSTAHFHY